MMVVDGLAGDVRVLAGGQVEALEQAQLGEQLESAEDGSAADRLRPAAGVFEQVSGGEGARATVEQLGHPTARARDPMTRRLESTHEWLWRWSKRADHGRQMILGIDCDGTIGGAVVTKGSLSPLDPAPNVGVAPLTASTGKKGQSDDRTDSTNARSLAGGWPPRARSVAH